VIKMNEKAFPNATHDFYRLLHIPKSELFKGSHKERIKQLPIIIEGLAGIGKTKLVENIIHAIQKWYGPENCNILYTNEFSLGILIYLAFKGFPDLGWNAKKPIQVLVFDDATSIKIDRQEQRQFFSIRHLMHDETSLNEGIVYTIFVTHEWWRLDTTFRRTALFSCFLSVPLLDQWTLREYAKFITQEGVNELLTRTSKALRFDKFKGIGLTVLPQPQPHIGRIYWQDHVNAEYWKLKRSPEKGEPYVDMFKHIIKYHPKEEMISEEIATQILEQRKQKNRERQKRWYWRQKKRLGETLDNET